MKQLDLKHVLEDVQKKIDLLGEIFVLETIKKKRVKKLEKIEKEKKSQKEKKKKFKKKK